MRRPIAGAALAALASLVLPGAGATAQGPSPGFVPKDAAAARQLRLEHQAIDLLNRADRLVRAKRPSCRPRTTPPGPATTADPPEQAVLDLLAPLRRPATPEDPLPSDSPFLGGVGAVHTGYVRRVTAANGQAFTIFVARDDRSRFQVSRSCRASSATAVTALLRGKPHALRVATRRIQAQLRADEARGRAQAGLRDGIFLVTRSSDGRSGGGGGGGDVRSFATHGNFISSGDRGGSRLSGLLPDGVATITLEYPRVVSRGRLFKPTRYAGAYTRTARVQENVVSVRVPREPGDAFPPRTVWRDAAGAVIRVVAGPR